MCTRGVWQVSNIVLRFCKHGGSSAGARAFITQQLGRFAEANPSIQINVVHSAGRHPLVVGKYRDGTSKEVDVKSEDADEILHVMHKLRSVKTGRVRHFKEVVSKSPTVQGTWDPSTTFEGFVLREAHSSVAKRV